MEDRVANSIVGAFAGLAIGLAMGSFAAVVLVGALGALVGLVGGQT